MRIVLQGTAAAQAPCTRRATPALPLARSWRLSCCPVMLCSINACCHAAPPRRRGTLVAVQPGAAFTALPPAYIADHDTAPQQVGWDVWPGLVWSRRQHVRVGS